MSADGSFLKKRHSFQALWATACLLIPPAIYLFAAMAARMNIGIRHVLPVMAFAAVGSGVVLSGLWDRLPWGRWLVAALLLVTAGETASATPHFIPFFNFAAGGSRGGLRLLGDSNLDWGQDLPELARWQRDHPERELYLSYFGVAESGVLWHPVPPAARELPVWSAAGEGSDPVARGHRAQRFTHAGAGRGARSPEPVRGLPGQATSRGARGLPLSLRGP